MQVRRAENFLQEMPYALLQERHEGEDSKGDEVLRSKNDSTSSDRSDKTHIWKMITNILQDIPHKIVQLPAKAILLDAGNIATDIFFVKTGCLRSWFNADGKDVTLQFF